MERVNSSPLEGLRVLSVEQYGAGPFGTMLLADLGADVIKVETPPFGDVARSVPPYISQEHDSLYFQSLNRNKRSIALDLDRAEDREHFDALVHTSDAVFNNLRGDQQVARRLDYGALSGINPAIVCVHLTGFGREGQRAAQPGYDYLMQGYAGWMDITGEPGGPPQKSGLSVVDLTAGIAAGLGLVSAVLAARQTGRGCDIDVSLFDTAFSLLTYLGTWHLTRGYMPERQADSSHPSQVPSQVFPTKDGHMIIMCAKEKFYRRFVEILGRPDLASDGRYIDFSTRLTNRDALIAELKSITVTRTTEEWLASLTNHVPCGPVNSVAEALRDPQVLDSGLILETSHAEFGPVKHLASPIRADGRNHAALKGAPGLGEHTAEILQELGRG